eukprot:gene7876-8726_t
MGKHGRGLSEREANVYDAKDREINMANRVDTEIREEAWKENDNNVQVILIGTSGVGYDEATEDEGCKNNDEKTPERDIIEFKKRGKYIKYSQEDKLKIGKLAAKHGNAFARKKYQGASYPKLSESTVRSFKKIYLKEQEKLLKKKQANKSEAKIRGKYQTYTEQKRAEIGRYASKNGIANALRQYKTELPALSESTVRGFKKAYIRELGNVAPPSKHKACQPTDGNDGDNHGEDVNSPTTVDDVSINSLPTKKRGRPIKVPSNMEATIARYLQAIAASEDKSLTYKTIIGITKGVIIAEDRSLLTDFGGRLCIDNSWVQSFLRRYSFNSKDPINSSTATTQDQTSNLLIQSMSEHQFECLSQEHGMISKTKNDNNDDEQRDNYVMNNCNLNVQPSVLMIVNNHGTESDKILEMGPTLKDLPAIVDMTTEQENDESNMINVKISGEEQSFMTPI